jgi:hypothetical protein
MLRNLYAFFGGGLATWLVGSGLMSLSGNRQPADDPTWRPLRSEASWTQATESADQSSPGRSDAPRVPPPRSCTEQPIPPEFFTAGPFKAPEDLERYMDSYRAQIPSLLTLVNSLLRPASERLTTCFVQSGGDHPEIIVQWQLEARPNSATLQSPTSVSTAAIPKSITRIVQSCIERSNLKSSKYEGTPSESASGPFPPYRGAYWQRIPITTAIRESRE